MSSTNKTKKVYQAPKIQTEKVGHAILATSCNGMQSGGSGRKGAAPCSVLLS